MKIEDAIAEIESIAAGKGIQLSETQLKLVGEEGLAIIIDRTKLGIDADHVKFKAYSPAYAKFREDHQRSSTTVDLAFTGHMQGAMTPTTNGTDVEIAFMSVTEEIKAASHIQGVHKTVDVKYHTRDAHIDIKTGRRVSRKEAKKDAKRKTKKIVKRTEYITGHERHMNLPKRDFFDIRHPTDEAKLSEVVGEMYKDNIEKRRR